ncbi:21518_t:CDS:1, partial [Entrophospora sp. SA101]
KANFSNRNFYDINTTLTGDSEKPIQEKPNHKHEDNVLLV